MSQKLFLQVLLTSIERAPTSREKVEGIAQLYRILNTHEYATEIIDKSPKLEQVAYNKAIEFIEHPDVAQTRCRDEIKQFIDRYNAKRSDAPMTRARAKKFHLQIA